MVSAWSLDLVKGRTRSNAGKKSEWGMLGKENEWPEKEGDMA